MPCSLLFWFFWEESELLVGLLFIVMKHVEYLIAANSAILSLEY